MKFFGKLLFVIERNERKQKIFFRDITKSLRNYLEFKVHVLIFILIYMSDPNSKLGIICYLRLSVLIVPCA